MLQGRFREILLQSVGELVLVETLGNALGIWGNSGGVVEGCWDLRRCNGGEGWDTGLPAALLSIAL